MADNSSVKIHSYYIDKVKEALRRAGIECDNVQELAEWASNYGATKRQARATDTKLSTAGVLLTEDGAIIGEYVRQHDLALGSVFHVSRATKDKYDLSHTVLDFALSSIQRIVDQRVIAISGDDLATGARN